MNRAPASRATGSVLWRRTGRLLEADVPGADVEIQTDGSLACADRIMHDTFAIHADVLREVPVDIAGGHVGGRVEADVVRIDHDDLARADAGVEHPGGAGVVEAGQVNSDLSSCDTYRIAKLRRCYWLDVALPEATGQRNIHSRDHDKRHEGGQAKSDERPGTSEPGADDQPDPEDDQNRGGDHLGRDVDDVGHIEGTQDAADDERRAQRQPRERGRLSWLRGWRWWLRLPARLRLWLPLRRGLWLPLRLGALLGCLCGPLPASRGIAGIRRGLRAVRDLGVQALCRVRILRRLGAVPERHGRRWYLAGTRCLLGRSRRGGALRRGGSGRGGWAGRWGRGTRCRRRRSGPPRPHLAGLGIARAEHDKGDRASDEQPEDDVPFVGGNRYEDQQADDSGGDGPQRSGRRAAVTEEMLRLGSLVILLRNEQPGDAIEQQPEPAEEAEHRKQHAEDDRVDVHVRTQATADAGQLPVGTAAPQLADAPARSFSAALPPTPGRRTAGRRRSAAGLTAARGRRRRSRAARGRRSRRTAASGRWRCPGWIAAYARRTCRADCGIGGGSLCARGTPSRPAPGVFIAASRVNSIRGLARANSVLGSACADVRGLRCRRRGVRWTARAVCRLARGRLGVTRRSCLAHGLNALPRRSPWHR